jgi:glycosyltransferase involved in cell wall biosynthesis
LWFHLAQGLRLGWKRRFDCVMAFNWGLAGIAALLLSRLLCTKLIIRVAGVPEDTYKYTEFGQQIFLHLTKTSFKTRLARLLSNLSFRLLARSCDRLELLYPNQLAQYPQLQSVASSVLPVFVPVSRVPFTGIDDGSILLVGAPWYRKGADVLIKAFQQLEEDFPSVRLRLLGHYPDQEVLSKIVGGSRRIEVLKARPNPEALRFIADCSVYVLASRSDAAPRVLLEAMAAGKPIVASRVGGVSHYIQDGINGLLFESENINDLAGKLRLMLTSAELRVRLGQSGYHLTRTKYSEHSWGCKMAEMIYLTVNNSSVRVSAGDRRSGVSN